MISTDLGHLSDWILGYAAKDEAPNREALTHLSKVVLDLANQARRLERIPVDDDYIRTNEADDE